MTRATFGATLRAGWPVFLPVVVGNAAVQAVLVAPAFTPAFGAGFIVIALISAPLTMAVTHLPVLPVWQILVVTTLLNVFMSGRMVPMMALITSWGLP